MIRKKLPNIPNLLRGHFLAGFLVLIPLGVIIWILMAALGALWQLRELIPAGMRPESIFEDQTVAHLVNGLLTIAVAAALALAISIVGWASKQYLGRKMLGLISDVIQRIPVVRSIYSALDQLIRTIASGTGQQFSRVVYVEYPRKGCWALAFVTGPARGPAAPTGHLNLYIPTTPNPTSGFHLIVPESEVRESQMKVEEAFKTILSLGIAQPGGSVDPGGQRG